MVCNTCHGETQVVNSRPQKRLNQVWRRRACTLCDAAFTTLEAIDYHKTLLVSSTKLKPFERDRLFLSLYKSLGHRPGALRDAGALCATVIAKLQPINGTVTARQIIETSLVALSRFDKLAAQHYQALHKTT